MVGDVLDGSEYCREYCEGMRMKDEKISLVFITHSSGMYVIYRCVTDTFGMSHLSISFRIPYTEEDQSVLTLP